MRMMFAERVRWWLVLLVFLSGKCIFAATLDGVNPLDSLGPMPTQQYVIGENGNPTPSAPAALPASTTAESATPSLAAPPVPDDATVPPLVNPNPAAVPPPNPSAPPANTTSATPAATSGPQPLTTQSTPTNAFAGGLNSAAFISCGRMATVMCVRSTDNMHYQSCLTRLTNPACQQFLAFAAAINFSLRDEIDLIKHYPQAQLDLLHVQRFGMNYPGDFYAISGSGDLVNITSGPQAQAVDITKDAIFSQIKNRFPKAQLWSIVEGLPQTAPSPDGRGLRLVFRFNIMNGCPNCELAGHANVAYDFSEQGQLKQVQLLSLEAS